MKIAITGASGLVGGVVVQRLQHAGHQVVRMVRSAAQASVGDWLWNGETGAVDARFEEGMDTLIHLAGENIATGRWTEERKRMIKESRVKGVRTLAAAIGRAKVRPRVVVSASATGFYGDRGDEVCTEDSEAGVGFLAEVCRDWEGGWESVERMGVRVVKLRIGMVLTSAGGALGKLRPFVRWGWGGVLGSGRQYWSWVHLDDLVNVVIRSMEDESLVGAVNVVAPQAVTNREFTRELAGVLGRPAWMPAPAFGLRLLLGEMADGILLCSARVRPYRLEAAGYRFLFPELKDALGAVSAGR